LPDFKSSSMRFLMKWLGALASEAFASVMVLPFAEG
jgi:hypothetical protein